MSTAALLMRMRAVRSLLQGYQYRYACEVQLHERLAEALTAGGYPFSREVAVRLPPLPVRPRLAVAGPRTAVHANAFAAKDGRFDFLLDPKLVIEVKVAGSLSEALRQAQRYCRMDEVDGVLLASTERWATTEPRLNPEAFGAKPVLLCHLRRQAL